MNTAYPDVSRETAERLGAYSELLRKWTRRINLVSASTLSDLEHRHLADSVQLVDAAPDDWRHWADLGSGGGLPGLVIAILVAGSDRQVTLVESDQRKCAFLRTVIRELDLLATVESARIEVLDPIHADVLSARALAPLATLLHHADRHLAPHGLALFPKGRNVRTEIAAARREWCFDLDELPSKTSPDAVILRLKDIHRA